MCRQTVICMVSAVTEGLCYLLYCGALPQASISIMWQWADSRRFMGFTACLTWCSKEA